MELVCPPPGLESKTPPRSSAFPVPTCSIESSPQQNDADAAAGEGQSGRLGRASARTRARADLRARARARRREAAATSNSTFMELPDERSDQGHSDNPESADGYGSSVSPKCSFQEGLDEITTLREELTKALSLCQAQKNEIVSLKSQNSFLLAEWQAAKEYALQQRDELLCLHHSELQMARTGLQTTQERLTYADHSLMTQNLMQSVAFSSDESSQSFVPPRSPIPLVPSTPPPLRVAMSEQTPSPSLQPRTLRLAEICDASCSPATLPLPAFVPLLSLESVGTWDSNTQDTSQSNV